MTMSSDAESGVALGMSLWLLKPGFPDDCRSGVNIRAFPAFLQEGREVRTATGTLGGSSATGSIDNSPGGFLLHW
jgi:hypothetical protein